MKFYRKGLALLLAICMIIGIAPTSVFATTNDTDTNIESNSDETTDPILLSTSQSSNDEFYKIVHLDAGRKYFTVSQIKTLIDGMAERGLNQLELYLADNQGFRLALDDMKITVGDTTYDLSISLGDGYTQNSSNTSGDDDHFKPSGENGYLTQSEMSSIISYAKSKGVEIVPCINVPGHMGAILNPYTTDDDDDPQDDNNPFADFRYTKDGNVSKSSIDLTNEDAVAFALAITQKYAAYFASQGCKYYSIGADEYAYDLDVSVATLPSLGLYDEFISFMNSAATIIKNLGMTPRAFNDAFYLTDDRNVDTSYQICFWNGQQTTLNAAVAKGHDIINSSQNIYWAIGSTWATESIVKTNLGSFDYKTFFGGGTVSNPAGTMFCIWNDDATAMTGDEILTSLLGSTSALARSTATGLLDLYSDALTDVDPVEIELAIGATTEEVFSVEGSYDSAGLAEKLGLSPYVTASNIGVIKGTEGGDVSVETSLSGGSKVIVGKIVEEVVDGETKEVGYWLTFDGTKYGVTTDATLATTWTVVDNGNNVNYGLIWNGYYLNGTENGLVGSTNQWSEGSKWLLKDGFLCNSSWPGYYISISDGEAGTSTTSDRVTIYSVSESTPDITTFTLKGEANGTVNLLSASGVEYKIIVGTGIPAHECDTNIAATCVSYTRCSICGKISGTEYDSTNHEGPFIAATCQEKETCSACGATVSDVYADHKYSESTCKEVGTCIVCGAKNPAGYADHVYSEANCINPATCSVCGETEGEKNPEVHTGNTEIKNKKDATTTETGYTGDLYCADCGELLVEGTIIPMIEEGVVEITIAVGASKNISVIGKDITGSVDEYDANVADVTTAYSSGSPETISSTQATELIAGTQVLIGDGTYYLTWDGESLGKVSVSDENAQSEAAIWTVEKFSDNYALKCDGKYLIEDKEYTSGSDLAMYDTAAKGWTLKGTSLKGAYYNFKYISLVDSPIASESNANVGIYVITPEQSAQSTISFTGKTVGTTYATIGDTKYKINVVSAELAEAALPVYTWITNTYVEFKDANGDSYEFDKIVATDDFCLTTELGVALSDIAPAKGVRENAGTDSQVVLWKGMLHTKEQRQLHTSAMGTDKSRVGETFKYIRYYNGVWQVSANRISWTTVEEGYYLDIYYLQETQVTREVITEVVDWGLDYDEVDKEVSWVSDGFALLDFAVYEDGYGRTPKLSPFPNDGHSSEEGVELANQKTVAYHTLINEEKVERDSDGNILRRVDIIYAEETEGYEVYMITVTRTNDDPSIVLKNENITYPSDLQNNDGEKDYSYDGKEYIAWTIDSQTFEEKVKTPTIDGKTLYALELMPDGFNPTSDSEMLTMYRTVGGEPIVNYVQIYQNQGMLVTYYIRGKETQDSLKVHYRMEGSETDFHNSLITVNTDTYFDNGLRPNEEKTTGLVSNTVQTINDKTYIVNSNLTQLLEVPSLYRTGSYEFTKHIGYILDGETSITYDLKVDDKGTVTIVDKRTGETVDSITGNVKEIVLYYSLDNMHYVPVDFGNPLKIEEGFFHFKTDSVEVNSVQLKSNSDDLLYGEISEKDDAFYYELDTVMLGAENTIYFDVNVTVNYEDTKESHTERHGVVFVPATTVYYEEAFALKNQEGWDENTDLSQTYAKSGAQETKCYGTIDNNYGYDPVYDAENESTKIGPSNGTQATSTSTAHWAEFTFNGTGVEIYANCTPDTSNARVLIFSGTSDNMTLKRVYMVDTRMINGDKDVTQGQNVEAYNVPIVSVNDLDYGTYTVRVGYMKSADSRDEPFKFDGFRVYNTLQSSDIVGETTAEEIYSKDKELNPNYVELRNIVLNTVGIPENYSGDYADVVAANIASQVCDINGVSQIGGLILYQKVKGDENSTAENEVVVDLIDNGPKNEIYLFKGQTLVFGCTSGSIQLGLKALNASVDCKITLKISDGSTTKDVEIKPSSTDMYYALADYIGEGCQIDNSSIMITNNSESQDAILSITKLKLFNDAVDNGGINLLLTEDSLEDALVVSGFALRRTIPMTFTDVTEDDYYYDAVRWAVSEQVTTGRSETIFDPNGNCTRAEALTFLWRSAGSPEVDTTTSPFVDVVKDSYYEKAVLWAYENGITNGMDATHFSPNDLVTRGQFVTFLWRALDEPAASIKNSFADIKAGAYYEKAVLWAYENEITTGVDIYHFAPDKTCTRAQSVTFLYRVYN